eukprot:7997759-Pyramimonas_sp.AAC.1
MAVCQILLHPATWATARSALRRRALPSRTRVLRTGPARCTTPADLPARAPRGRARLPARKSTPKCRMAAAPLRRARLGPARSGSPRLRKASCARSVNAT